MSLGGVCCLHDPMLMFELDADISILYLYNIFICIYDLQMKSLSDSLREVFPTLEESKLTQVEEAFIHWLHYRELEVNDEILQGFSSRLSQMIVGRSAADKRKERAAKRRKIDDKNESGKTGEDRDDEDIDYCIRCPAYLYCQLKLIYRSEHFVVFDKPWDFRIDRKEDELPNFQNEPTVAQRFHQVFGNDLNVRFCHQLGITFTHTPLTHVVVSL